MNRPRNEKGPEAGGSRAGTFNRVRSAGPGYPVRIMTATRRMCAATRINIPRLLGEADKPKLLVGTKLFYHFSTWRVLCDSQTVVARKICPPRRRGQPVVSIPAAWHVPQGDFAVP